MKQLMSNAELKAILRHLEPLLLAAENSHSRYKEYCKTHGDDYSAGQLTYWQNYAAAMRHAIATAKQRGRVPANG